MEYGDIWLLLLVGGGEVFRCFFIVVNKVYE